MRATAHRNKETGLQPLRSRLSPSPFFCSCFGRIPSNPHPFAHTPSHAPGAHRQLCESPGCGHGSLAPPDRPPSVVRIRRSRPRPPGRPPSPSCCCRGERTLTLSTTARRRPKSDAVHGKTLDLRQNPGILEGSHWWVRPARNGTSQNRVCITGGTKHAVYHISPYTGSCSHRGCASGGSSGDANSATRAYSSHGQPAHDQEGAVGQRTLPG
jgi:hypothetical protein